MSLIDDDGRIVHYPRNPDKFEFDDEVASSFEDMARRSIPLYLDTHSVHSEFLYRYVDWLSRGTDEPLRILDIGASTGNFAVELLAQHRYEGRPQPIEIVAIDTSSAMCEVMRERFRYEDAVEVVEAGTDSLAAFTQPYDCINLAYVYQFIPEHARSRVFRELHRLLKRKGVLLVSQKFSYKNAGSESWIVEELVQKLYYGFRMRNGYTKEEIEAKTQALRESMWPQNDNDFMGQIRAANFEPYLLTRWLSFGSYVCLKQR